MTNTLKHATEIVDSTFRSKTGPRKQRAQRLLSFANDHDVTLESVQVIKNNSWSRPPKSRFARLLGGTTYQYQVWACLK